MKCFTPAKSFLLTVELCLISLLRAIFVNLLSRVSNVTKKIKLHVLVSEVSFICLPMPLDVCEPVIASKFLEIFVRLSYRNATRAIGQ